MFSFFTIELTELMQMIPTWWRWYYWADPASWTVYGLMASQLGDQSGLIHVPGQSDLTVQEFVEDFLGLKVDNFSLIVCLHLGIVVLFLFVYGFGIKHLNFQKRWWRKLHLSTSDFVFYRYHEAEIYESNKTLMFLIDFLVEMSFYLLESNMMSNLWTEAGT